jgi:hypothetical protein
MWPAPERKRPFPILTHVSSYFPTDGPSSRRGFFEKGAAALATGAAIVTASPARANAYALPDLPYPFEALEPYIDAPTMK